MQRNNQKANKLDITPKCLRSIMKTIGHLSRTGMEAGNNRNFSKAFLNMDDALSLSKELNKKCLEAKILNNFGLLYTMNGKWDKALLMFDQSLTIVVDHYGTHNILYKTIQKNLGTLLNPKEEPVQ